APRRTTPPPRPDPGEHTGRARCAPRTVHRRTRGVQQRSLDTPAPAEPGGGRTTGPGRRHSAPAVTPLFPFTPTHFRIHPGHSHARSTWNGAITMSTNLAEHDTTVDSTNDDAVDPAVDVAETTGTAAEQDTYPYILRRVDPRELRADGNSRVV